MKKNNSKFTKVLNAVKDRLQEEIAPKIEDIILFGSYARGDQHTGSDIDLLLVLKQDMTEEEKKQVNQMLSEISLENNIVVSCNAYRKEDYAARNTPFLLNVKKEGIRV